MTFQKLVAQVLLRHGSGIAKTDVAAEEVVLSYHERAKHRFHCYVAALNIIFWAMQPDPFQRCMGQDIVLLPRSLSKRMCQQMSALLAID